MQVYPNVGLIHMSDLMLGPCMVLTKKTNGIAKEQYDCKRNIRLSCYSPR